MMVGAGLDGALRDLARASVNLAEAGAEALGTQLAARVRGLFAGLGDRLDALGSELGVGGLMELGARTCADLERALGLSLFFPEPGLEHGATSVQVLDIALLAVIGLVVIAAVRVRHATARHRLELARRMVERGMEPPEDLLGATPEHDLRRGLVLVFGGAGLLAASFIGGRGGMSPAGLIPGFIGIGYLVSHRLGVARRERERARDLRREGNHRGPRGDHR